MAKEKKNRDGKPFEIPRPEFPKRAVITGGMPYGNKELHFGHVGGMLGMLVAIPAYTVIRVIASRFFYHLKPVRRLMPDRTEEDQWLES